jgi:hypothetical protein
VLALNSKICYGVISSTKFPSSKVSLPKMNALSKRSSFLVLNFIDYLSQSDIIPLPVIANSGFWYFQKETFRACLSFSYVDF